MPQRDRDQEVDEYRRLLQQGIIRLAAATPSHGAIETVALCDQEQDHYQVLQVGWDCGGLLSV